MSDFASFDLTKAVFARLHGYAALMDKVSGVFDHQPNDWGSACPYVEVGDSTSRDWSGSTFSGHEHTFEIQVFSRTGGRRGLKAIMSTVHEILNDASLTLDGHTLINMRMASSSDTCLHDGSTYQGTLTFRAVTQEHSS